MSAILTLGEPLAVFAPKRRGRIIDGPDFGIGVAGSELNVAIALARLEVSSWFSGAVGDDAVGLMVRQTLLREGVRTDLLDTREDPTGIMIKEWYGLRSEPRVYYYRKQTAVHGWNPPPCLPKELSHGWVHTSGITLMVNEGLKTRIESSIQQWLSQPQVRLSLDLNVRRRLGPLSEWRGRLNKVLAMASIVFASASELSQLWGASGSRNLVQQGVLNPEQILVITDGAAGSWVEKNGDVLAQAEAQVVADVIDVVGAGDGFAAGVLAGHLRGWDWPQCLTLGNLVGAFAVAHPGDWEGYPFLREAMAVLGDAWIDR